MDTAPWWVEEEWKNGRKKERNKVKQCKGGGGGVAGKTQKENWKEKN